MKTRVFVPFAVAALALCFVSSEPTGAQFPPRFGGGNRPAVQSVRRVYVAPARVIDQRFTPGEPLVVAYRPRLMPIQLGVDPRTYMLRKQFAALGLYAPYDFSPETTPFLTTPSASPNFAGQGDACFCSPPDMALAASTKFEMQGVNVSFAVYGPHGGLQSAWPKTAVSFFNIPSPVPAGCGSPIVYDPRLFYDPNDHRFFAAITEVEGAFGVNTGCSYASRVWFAVSRTSDPRGVWNVYAFNTDNVGDQRALDFTELGFDNQAFYIGGNMFTQSGDAYDDAEVFWFSKAQAEAGNSLSGFYSEGFNDGHTDFDTVQPVLTETSSAQAPGVEYLINSENINFSGCSFGCSTITIWSIENPLTSPVIKYAAVTSKNYALAPMADEPGCTHCVETFDTRISAQPVYSASRNNGVISFALESGVNNGTQIVPAVFWGEIHPVLGSGGIVSAIVYQSGYIKGSGDQANSFGATMASTDGSLWIVNDRMSASLNPGAVFRVNRKTDSLGHFEGKATLKGGVTSTFDPRWGDYEAMGLDDSGHVWMAAQFAPITRDWATFIGRDI